MRLSPLIALPLATSAVAGGPHTPIVRRQADLDLTSVPIVNLVTALVDKLPIDVEVSALPNADIIRILSCVVDTLPMDVSVGVLASSTTAAPQTTVITTTRTVYVPAATAGAAGAAKKRALSDLDLDLSKVPIVNIVSGIVDKLPVDADVGVLQGGLSDLKDIDLQKVGECVAGKLQGALSA